VSQKPLKSLKQLRRSGDQAGVGLLFVSLWAVNAGNLAAKFYSGQVIALCSVGWV
jgi:hypothetical protein